MLLPRLYVAAFAFLFLSFAVAEDQPGQIQKPSTDVSKPDLSATMSKEQRDATYSYLLRALGRHPRVAILNPDATCYAMRTYQVQRDDPDSDSVHPVAYTTCQPALRFQVKTSDDTIVIDTRKNK
jgi:hypothetical protein